MAGILKPAEARGLRNGWGPDLTAETQRSAEENAEKTRVRRPCSNGSSWPRKPRGFEAAEICFGESRLALHNVANELVPFQRCRDLVTRAFTRLRMRAQHLAHTPDVNRLGSVVIQGNHVFDGAPRVGLPIGSEQNAARADIPGLSHQIDSLSPAFGDREGKLQFESPCAPLFHFVDWQS